MTADPIAIAARNNAEWCDAVARAHGHDCRFDTALWINHGEAPPLYPNAVTLQGDGAEAAQIAALRVLVAAAPDRTLAVKDSFNRLDLTPLGFAPLFDAKWIWRDASPPPAPAGADWLRVHDAATLAAWVRGWGGGEGASGAAIFRPSLLDQPRHALLGCRRSDHFLAGCVASRSAQAVGISNIFLPEDDAGPFRAGCVAAAMALAPGLPLVGYESDETLAAMISLNFQALGSLRVWIRTPEQRVDFIAG